MKTLIYYAAAWLLATAASGQELNWAELARRSDLWPPQCAAKTEMKFDGGVTIKPGQPLKVLKVTAAEVQVSTLDDRTTFTAEPGETDVLAVAQQAFAKLTPKQRALSFDTLLRQKELWPQFVTLKRSFDLAPGKAVRAGDQVELMNLEPGGIAVKSESLKATFKVVTDATDLMTQARKLVEDEKAAPRFVDARKQEQTKQIVVEQKKQNFGPVITELEDKLVSSVTGKPAPLDTTALPRY